MPAKAKAIVLDSWAVIAYLEDEPAGAKVANLIADAHEAAIPLYMAVVNAGEVWYILARKASEAEADESISELQDIGIQFVEIEWKLTRDAAIFKSKHKMSYADCHAAALAKKMKAHLVTGDKEFSPLDGEIKISWLE